MEYKNNENLKEYIKGLKIQNKNEEIFNAYKIALKESRKKILSIINDSQENKYTIFINKIAYKISIEMKKEMDDTNHKIQKILEDALGIKHNYIKKTA